MINKFHLRKAEEERLSSSEQLDTAMRVTTPAGWVALIALGSLIAAAMAWSVWGTLSDKVEGSGMLLRGENVLAVQAPTSGQVKEVKVTIGELIQKGHVVAVLSLPEVDAEIKATGERLKELRQRKAGQDAEFVQLRQSYSTQLKGLQEELRQTKELEAQGLAVRSEILAIEGQIAGIRAQILQAKIGEGDIDATIGEQKRHLERLKKSQHENSEIASPFTGKVGAILVNVGQLIETGSRIVNLEGPQDELLQALLYVRFAEGKKVEKGMKVRISPSTLEPEDVGYILGEITNVSRLPVAFEEVRATLNIEHLARKYAEDTPFEARARLLLDAAGRPRWTSTKGASLEIESNTPCSAQVITGERPPIEYVIPKVKEILGLG